MCSNEKGMTFLELLLVLMVVGVLTIIVIPASEGWSTTQSERDALHSLQATIQHMQSYSMANQTTTWLEFSQDGKRYSVEYWDTRKKETMYFPHTISFSSSSQLKNVSFQANGNMYKTGTLVFDTAGGRKRMAFQFQRGRMLLYE